MVKRQQFLFLNPSAWVKMNCANDTASRRLRIVIYLNDHEPAHVHVVGPNGEARVRLGDVRVKPELIANDGLSTREVAETLAAIDAEWNVLQRRWKEIHGNR